MKRGSWTTTELNKMATLYNEGLDIDDIAFRMERSKKSIENAVRNYRKTLKLEYRRDRPKKDPQKKDKELKALLASVGK